MGNNQSAELQLAVMANILIKRPIPHTDNTFYTNLIALPTTPDEIYANFTHTTLRNILTHQPANYATLLKAVTMELHGIVWRGKQTVRVVSGASLAGAGSSGGGGGEWLVGERKERLLSCLRLLTRLVAVVNENPDGAMRHYMCGSVLAGMLEAEEEKRRQRIAADARKERERKNAAEMEKRAMAMAMEREKERQKEEQVRWEAEAKTATAAVEAAQAAAINNKQTIANIAAHITATTASTVAGGGGGSPVQGSSPFAGGSVNGPKAGEGKHGEEEEFAEEEEGKPEVAVVDGGEDGGGGGGGEPKAEVAVARVMDEDGVVSEVEVEVRSDGPDGNGTKAPEEASPATNGDAAASTAAAADTAYAANGNEAESDFDFISAVASKAPAAASSEQHAADSSAPASNTATSTEATTVEQQSAAAGPASAQAASDATATQTASTDTATAPPTQPPAQSTDHTTASDAASATADASATSAAIAITQPTATASSSSSSSTPPTASSSFAPSTTTTAACTTASTPTTTVASSSTPAPLPPLSLDSWWVGELYGQPLHSLLTTLLIDLCFLPSFTTPPTTTPSVSRHDLNLGRCWATGCGWPAKLAPSAYTEGGDRAAAEWELDMSRVEVLRCLLAVCGGPMFRSVVVHNDVLVGDVVGVRREWSVTLGYSMLNVLLGWRVETSVPYATAIWTDYRKPLVEMCAHLLMILLDHQVTNTQQQQDSTDDSESSTDDSSSDSTQGGRSISAASSHSQQSQLSRNESVASITSFSNHPPSIRVPSDSHISTSALTTSRHANPATQQQIEQQQTLHYQPHYNLFSTHLYSLSPPDCTYFYTSICRLLSHGLLAAATWLPSSSTATGLEAELLVLMWKMLDNHPTFLHHVLNECDVLALLTPLLFYCFDARKDASRLGLLYTGVFTLLKLSGEREFAVRLNSAVPTPALAHLPLVHLLGMPELQGGTYADALVLVAHKLIVSSPNHLDALLKVLLTLLANVSPYITRLSTVSAMRLVSLFELFCQPAYIYGKEHNHVYAALLLDLFNNLIQYQWQGSAPLVLAIVRRAEVFYSLRLVGEDGEHYVQPMTGVGARGHAVVFRERHRAAGLSVGGGVGVQPSPRRSASAAGMGPATAGQGVVGGQGGMGEQPDSAATTATPTTSPLPTTDSAADDATTGRPLSASQPLPSNPPQQPTRTDSPTTTNTTTTLPASRPLAQSISTASNHSTTSTTSNLPPPVPSNSSSTSSHTAPPTGHLAIPPFNLSQYATPQFHPTHAWANSWKSRLPLETIYRLYDHTLPRLATLAAPHPLTDDTVLDWLEGQTLVGILPLPHAIVVRRYIRNEWTNSWFSVYLWGLVFLKQQRPKLFDGKKVRLFAISSRGGGGGGEGGDGGAGGEEAGEE